MKINYRQTCILVLMCQIALKFLALPSLMYIISGSDSIFAIIFLMIIDGLYAFMLLSMAQKSGEKNFYEFVSSCLGKPITKILLIFLMAKFALVVVNISKGLEYFVVDNLYNEFEWYYYVIPLIAVVGYMVYRGINNIARVGEIVCWFICLGVIYIALKSFANSDAGTFLPLFKDGVKPLVSSGWQHMSWFGSSTFLLMLFGKIDFKNKKPIKMAVYIGLAIALVALVHFVFYGIFQVTSPTHNFCISDISQFSSIHSSIDELSWLIVSLWIVAQAVQIAIYSYCFVQTFKFLFNVKNDTFPTLVIMFIIAALSLIGENTIRLQTMFSSMPARVVAFLAQYVVPLIVWLAVTIKGAKENHKINTNNKATLTKQANTTKSKIIQPKAKNLRRAK